MITRRSFSQLLAGASLAGGAPKGTRPNIVMIYADDLGYGDLGCYGHPTIRTPNLDRMAADGARFTQFYSAAPVCTPSRAALLTGRYPMRSGLTRVLFPQSTGGIPDSEITVAESLKGAGYKTAAIGKWHLGHLPKYLPTNHGFDTYFGIPYSNDMSPIPGPGAPGDKKHPPLPLVRGTQVVETEPDQTQLTRRYTEEAVSQIQAAKGNPFFVYLAHTMPHVPLYASERFRGKSARGLYGDVIEEIDWSVGEVLGTLKKNGLEKNTLVVFSSDNGPWLVKKELGGSAGLLREGKQTTWDGGMRVPCIARWTGTVPSGLVTQAQAGTMDLFPTFLGYAGIPMPQDRVYDGEDIRGVLTGQGQDRERTFYYWRSEDLCAVRKGPWKLAVRDIEAQNPPGSDTVLDKPQLYNLFVDPSEKQDAAAANPQVVAELSGLLQQHVAGMKPGAFQR